MHVGQMLAFHSESDAASQECIQRLRLLVEKRANVHLATIDIRNPGERPSRELFATARDGRVQRTGPPSERTAVSAPVAANVCGGSPSASR